MQDGAYAYKTIPAERLHPRRGGISLLWPALGWLSLALTAGAVAARVAGGPRFDGLLIFAAGAAAVVVTLRLMIREAAPRVVVAAPSFEPLKDLFESAGPAVVGIGLDGRLTYVNPSAERMLGYHAEELMMEWATFEILGPGEGLRLVAEMQKLCGIERPPEPTPAGRMAAYMDCVRSLPPSRVPSFDAQLRRKDGAAPGHAAHLRPARQRGVITGLVAVAVDGRNPAPGPGPARVAGALSRPV